MQALSAKSAYNLQIFCNAAHQNFLVAAFFLLYNIFRKNYSDVRKIMAKTAKFTVYEKLSKKQRREIDNAKRGNWGLVKPITKVKPSGKLYKRSKAKQDVQAYSSACTSCFAL